MYGCGSDSDSGNLKTLPNCQLTQTDCSSQGKTLDATTCTCVDSQIPQGCQITQAVCESQGKKLDAANCTCVDSGSPQDNCPLTEAMCASANKTLDAESCTCVDIEIPPNCQITQSDCEKIDKSFDAGNCACVESPIAQECKTEGFVKCGNTCIDPKSSIAYCGANENCENYIACKDSETCTEGRCRPTKCESNEHFYDVICEKDSIDNCGEHGFKCAEQVEGWKSGDCTDKACVPSACAAGRHPFGNACEPDEANHCGDHDTDCSIKIAGWSEGTCTNGACQVSACQKGLHLYENTCETDDLNNCGNHGTSCSLTVNGWKAGNCIDAACKVSECAEGMHVYENACEIDTVENCGLHDRACANTVAGWKSGACTQGKCEVLQCIDGFHVDAKTGKCVQDTNACCGASCTQCTGELVCAGGQCRSQCKSDELYCNGECINIKTSTTNCGTCGHNCNDDLPENGQTMICSGGSCQLTECMKDHHISENTCEADSETACGAEAKNCTADAWWDSGDCIDGKCVPDACKGDYHLAQNESGKNWCEPNNDLNCGEHGLECTGGQQCVGGRCLGNTICDGVLRNTLSDLDHCGDCSHRCDDGLICDQGQCKLGNGTAYCSGTKVTMGTIDRCSSCTDKCADSLICQNNACIAGAGITYCSSVTIDTRTNIDNCGSCDHKCDEGLICSEGTCQAGNGLMYCSDLLINSTTDSANCGGCDNLCPTGSICGNDSSTLGCIEGPGETYCDGIFLNTSNDSANCGQCGNKCDVGQICKEGMCSTGTGQTFCNGVSVNTSNNFFNCNQCSKACSIDQGCWNGTCANYIVGDIVLFGRYPQSDDETTEPIQWRILEIDNVNHKMLLLSEYVLDSQQYHDTSITWADSSLRTWLNNDFMTAAFTATEQAKILTTSLTNPDNPFSGTSGGIDTNDKVFLLALSDVFGENSHYIDGYWYFNNNKDRKAMATFYAVIKGVNAYNFGTSSSCSTTNFEINKCSALWWLRSPGLSAGKAACVRNDGYVSGDGCAIIYSLAGVRPALWVNYYFCGFVRRETFDRTSLPARYTMRIGVARLRATTWGRLYTRHDTRFGTSGDVGMYRGAYLRLPLYIATISRVHAHADAWLFCRRFAMEAGMPKMSFSELSENVAALPYHDLVRLMEVIVNSLRMHEKENTPKDEKYWETIAKKYQGCMEELWDGVDPVEYQRSMREDRVIG